MIRATLERLLRLPPAPQPPPGDEASARVFRAAPKYFQYRFVLWLIGTGLIMLAAALPMLTVSVALLSHSQTRGAGAVVVALVLGCALLLILLSRLLALAVLRLDYERRWYLVTDRSLRIREGVWVVRETTVTFANIQNLAVSQGPIQRALGLFDLRVDTAGGGGGGAHAHRGTPLTSLHAAVFRGIDNAEEIKALIQQRLRALKDAGLGDADDRPALPSDDAFLAALRAVHAEAQALRATAA